MSDKPTPNPGSNEALALGCKCPVLDNHHGRGCDWGEGMFIQNMDCPLHGAGKSDPAPYPFEGMDCWPEHEEG